MPSRFTPYAAVYLILRRGDEVLLLQRKGTGYKDGCFGLVSGHIDGNESARAAMVREAREEAGIVILENDLAFGCVMHRFAPDREFLDIFFTCAKWEGTIANAEPHKCAELRFFPLSALPPETIDYVADALRATTDKTHYLEHGWKTV